MAQRATYNNNNTNCATRSRATSPCISHRPILTLRDLPPPAPIHPQTNSCPQELHHKRKRECNTRQPSASDMGDTSADHRVMKKLRERHPQLQTARTENDLLDTIDRYVTLGVYTEHMMQQNSHVKLAVPGVEEESRQQLRQMEVLTSKSHDLLAALNGIAAVSSSKGAMVEGAIRSTLRQRFPDMEVRDTGKKVACADIHLLPTASDPSSGKVLIEVKSYKTAVPAKEVTKFERDVDRVQFPLAIMVAVGTGIAGKASMCVEHRGQTTVMYIPHGTADLLVMAVQLLQIHHSHVQRIEQATNTHIDELIARHSLLDHMKEVVHEIQEEMLQDTRFYSDVLTTCEQLDNLVQKQRLAVQDHRERFQALGRRWRDRLTSELDIATSAMVPGADTATFVTTPEASETLIAVAADRVQQSSDVRKRTHLAIQRVLEEACQLGMRLQQAKCGGIVVHQKGEGCKPFAVVEFKKTKAQLSGMGGATWHIELSNKSIERTLTFVRNMSACV